MNHGYYAYGFFVIYYYNMNDNLDLYIPFTKKDNEKKLVFGYASTEAVDSQGEIVSKQAITEALPDYMKFANIREMHQPSAVGKTKSAKIDKKGLFISAKVVDPLAWTKIKEGVYNGFSIGGRKLTSVGKKITKLKLSEISLVDRPANPESVFTLFKSGAETESVVGVGYKEPSKKEKKLQEEISDLYDTAFILTLAKELAQMIMTFQMLKKPTKELLSAMRNLKSAAKENLGKAEYSNMNKLFKAVMDDKEISKVSKNDFAYIDNKGGKQLPIHDKAHVINTIAKFNRIDFESTDAKIKAAKKILTVAKKLGVNISSHSEVAREANTQKVESISVTQISWEMDYYKDLRKVLG